MRLSLSDVYRVSNLPSGVTLDDIARAERELGFRFPPGYAELATALGCGSFGVTARVFDPQRTIEHTKSSRSASVVEERHPPELAALLRQSPSVAASMAFRNESWWVGYRNGEGPLLYRPRDGACYLESEVLEYERQGTDLLEIFGGWLSSEMKPPYEFESSDASARVTFHSATPAPLSLLDARFDEWIDAFRSVERPALEKSLGARGEAHRYVNLYFRAFGGYAEIMRSPGGVSVIVVHDRDADCPALENVLHTAQRLGLVAE